MKLHENKIVCESSSTCAKVSLKRY